MISDNNVKVKYLTFKNRMVDLEKIALVKCSGSNLNLTEIYLEGVSETVFVGENFGLVQDFITEVTYFNLGIPKTFTFESVVASFEEYSREWRDRRN